MNSIYWVITRNCNQRCPHCYNDSEPGADGLTFEQATRCVEALPDPDQTHINWIALSGGEVLVEPELMFHTLRALYAKYGDRVELYIQTNGDLLNEATLDKLLEHHVNRIDVSSLDRFHKTISRDRVPQVKAMFESRGFKPIDFDGKTPYPMDRGLWYSFWGATEDMWIGPLWPRGRAHQSGLVKSMPEHRFCEHGSGAKGFLDYQTLNCSVNIQLSDVYPCCPMTCRPIGDLMDETLLEMFKRCAHHPVYRALNEGKPERMGEYLGLSEDYGFERSRILGNHCLWCDEFFTKHTPGLLKSGTRTERGTVDLTISAG